MVCFMIVLGVVLVPYVSEYFHLLLLFVAVNFFQSTFSWGICPPTIVMRKLGWIAQDPADPPVQVERVYFFGRGLPSSEVGTEKQGSSTATVQSE